MFKVKDSVSVVGVDYTVYLRTVVGQGGQICRLVYTVCFLAPSHLNGSTRFEGGDAPTAEKVDNNQAYYCLHVLDGGCQ